MNKLIFNALFSNEDIEKISFNEKGRRFGWSVLLSGLLLATALTSFVFIYFNVPDKYNSRVSATDCDILDTQNSSSVIKHLLFGGKNENEAKVSCCGEPYAQYQVDEEYKILLRLDRSLIGQP